MANHEHASQSRDRLHLRPFAREDFGDLIRWTPSAQFLMQWAGPNLEWPLDEAQLETRLLQSQDPGSDLKAFTAVEAATGRAVGHIELARIDATHRSATVSCVLLAEGMRGRGAGREMVTRVLEVAFDELHLHRAQLHVFDFNEQAIAAYEGAGFRKEGLLRDARRVGDEFWSQWVMAILEDEWQSTIRRKFMEKDPSPKGPNQAVPTVGVPLSEDRLRLAIPQWETTNAFIRQMDELEMGEAEPATIYVWEDTKP